MADQKTHATVIAVVSGKGGVGKTMLAVAVANELSKASRTLLLDLDFFNRGLSGLFGQGEIDARVTPPDFLREVGDAQWGTYQIATDLYTILFPDVGGEDLTNLEALSTHTISSAIRNWINGLCEMLDCQTVVLDCHGGPDALSFSAVTVADKTLLVSEPDRITMYGTLHFMRKLSELSIDDSNVHLVVAKVVESISPKFLWRMYDGDLRERFGGKPLLAAFPLELYLTKAFEHDPLVTEHFPHSMLAQKTQVMLADLFGDTRQDLLSWRIRRIPFWLTYYTRYFFGRIPRVLDLNFLAAAGFVLLLLILAVQWGRKQDEFFILAHKLNEHLEPLLILWALFAAIGVVLSWTSYLDRTISLYAQRRKYVFSAWHGAMLTFVWSAAMGLLMLLVSKTDASSPPLALGIVGLSLCFAIAIWAREIYQSYRDIRFASNRVGGIIKFVCLFAMWGGGLTLRTVFD